MPGAHWRTRHDADAFELLRALPAIGDFLAYQYLIDLNYSALSTSMRWISWSPAPERSDGIRKCFGPAAARHRADFIRYMAETQEDHFARLGSSSTLCGRRLQLIDCQNLFCEVDKYARVAHPEVAGISGRTRIKQQFAPPGPMPTSWFPPKWGINGPTLETDLNAAAGAPNLRDQLVAVEVLARTSTLVLLYRSTWAYPATTVTRPGVSPPAPQT